VIDAAAIRYTLGLAAIKDLKIAILDVPTAYLGATLEEEVHLRLPDADWRMFGLSSPRPVVRLNKSVPGLKQPGRCWFNDISGYLTGSLGMPQSISAPALFHSKDLIINLYVDDLLISGKKDALRQILDDLGVRFQTKGEICGDTLSYLGLAITRDRKKLQITINQSGYLRKVVEKFDMLNSKGRVTPMMHP